LPKIPSDGWLLNPPKSPFFKGGLYKEFRQVPPFGKGGLGGIWFLGACAITEKTFGNPYKSYAENLVKNCSKNLD
jgi:hypothetical protein